MALDLNLTPTIDPNNPAAQRREAIKGGDLLADKSVTARKLAPDVLGDDVIQRARESGDHASPAQHGDEYKEIAESGKPDEGGEDVMALARRHHHHDYQYLDQREVNVSATEDDNDDPIENPTWGPMPPYENDWSIRSIGWDTTRPIYGPVRIYGEYSIDGGTTWTEPVLVGVVPPGRKRFVYRASGYNFNPDSALPSQDRYYIHVLGQSPTRALRVPRSGTNGKLDAGWLPQRALAGPGFRYNFLPDTGTAATGGYYFASYHWGGYYFMHVGYPYAGSGGASDSDPLTGNFKFNHLTPTSATIIRIHKTDADGASVDSVLGLWDDATLTTRGHILIRDEDDPANFLLFKITADSTDRTTWRDFTVTLVSSGGTFTDEVVTTARIEFLQIAPHDGTGRRIMASITPSQITASQTNYDPTGGSTASVWRLSTDASRTIQGLRYLYDGESITIINVGNYDIVLANNDVGASVEDRIITGTGASVTVAPDGVARLWYDGDSNRWRLI